MRFKTKIIGGFVVVFIIGAILGLFGLYSANSLTKMAQTQREMQIASSEVTDVLNAHNVWKQSLTEAVLTMSPFTGSLDPNACALGKWKNSDSAKNMDDEQILALLAALDEPHTYIHTEAAIIVELIEAGEKDEATSLLVGNILPRTQEAIDLLGNMEQRYMTILEDQTSEIVAFGTRMSTLVIIFIVIAFLLSLALSYIIIKSIMRPIRKIAAAAGTISIGDLDVDVSYNIDDEIGALAVAFEKMVDTTKEQVAITEALADGDLSIDVHVRSEKDAMNKALKKMLTELNNMFAEIHNATDQVATGSGQVAEGSQALAQGSTEQAAAVEELSASISDIADKTQANAQMAGKAARMSKAIMNDARKGSEQMSNMTEAVREINTASQSINKVIKVIDDIAFQTNILALNAAVEAARAGQHGKGFAVVAEEVRNLAAKSAEAAKDTGGLIANSMQKAELGARIAEDTAASLDQIVSSINDSVEIIGEIAKSSEEQSAGIVQINKGIEQVAQVIQQNSATAQQSAAASEQMSGQSDMLKQLISKFKIKGR